MHGTSSLTIETHSLGEGLSNYHLETFLDEMSHSISVLLKVTRGETLVSYIEVWEEVIFLHYLSNFVPLLWGWVNTSRVVGTSVEEDNGAWLGVGKILQHAIEVQTLGLGVKVSIFSDFKTCSLEDLGVVSPGGFALIDGSVSELSQEISNNLEGTST